MARVAEALAGYQVLRANERRWTIRGEKRRSDREHSIKSSIPEEECSSTVEPLSSMHEVLSSNPSTQTKPKQKGAVMLTRGMKTGLDMKDEISLCTSVLEFTIILLRFVFLIWDYRHAQAASRTGF